MTVADQRGTDGVIIARGPQHFDRGNRHGSPLVREKFIKYVRFRQTTVCFRQSDFATVALNLTKFYEVGMFKKTVLVALFATVPFLPLLAQTTFGRIAGAVTDPTGAGVPDAKVVIRNTDTQAAREIRTDERGYYSVENLPIGPSITEWIIRGSSVRAKAGSSSWPTGA